MLTDVTPPKGGGIYIIWLSDKHYYGGRTTSFERRWKEHLADLQRGQHSNPRMQNVYNKYGVFRPEVVSRLKRASHKEAEQEWLDEHYGKRWCVNVSARATGGNIVDWTPEKRKAHSETLTGLTRSPESIKRQVESWHANPGNLEKARASQAQNSCRDPETLAKNARKAAEHNRGLSLSPERVEKVRRAHLGRKNTPETIELMSRSAKERATRNPMSHGPATRKKISEIQKSLTWINNGTQNKKVPKSDLPSWLAQGWVRGRYSKKKVAPKKAPKPAHGNTKGLVWLYHPDLDKRKRARPEQLGELFEQGWVKRPPSAGKVWVRRKNPAGGWETQRVNEKELPALKEEGWELGFRPATERQKQAVRRMWDDPANRKAASRRAKAQGNKTRGTVWVYREDSGYRRVPPEEWEKLSGEGWVRKGPRSR